MLGRSRTAGQRALSATRAGMPELAAMLATLLGRPVEDKTGWKGFFDFALEWSPDETQVTLDKNGKDTQGEPVDGPTGPSLFMVLQNRV
jgi:uncharacterized protein (TIGR03435 family)